MKLDQFLGYDLKVWPPQDEAPFGKIQGYLSISDVWWSSGIQKAKSQIFYGPNQSLCDSRERIHQLIEISRSDLNGEYVMVAFNLVAPGYVSGHLYPTEETTEFQYVSMGYDIADEFGFSPFAELRSYMEVNTESFPRINRWGLLDSLADAMSIIPFCEDSYSEDKPFFPVEVLIELSTFRFKSADA